MKKIEWSLYQNNKELQPLKFSNNKTQKDVVKEVIDSVNQGHKVIFIKGVCGTGKSAIALNIANYFGKTSIVVPSKSLQEQYSRDYTEKKYLMKNKEKLKIKIITGRRNHLCPYIKENPDFFEKQKSKNTTLNIFDNNIPDNYEKQENPTCDNLILPCKIEIKKKNKGIIGKYLKENNKIRNPSFFSINDVRRMSIAPICPYWSPITPSEIDLNLDDAHRRQYLGLNNTNYTFYKRKKGCPYYDQYDSYIDSDVLIFNSHKYLLETTMNRKPCTKVDIIDECDEFLDSFSSTKKLNLDRLYFSLSTLFPEDDETRDKINEILDLVALILDDNTIEKKIFDKEILHINKTRISKIFQKFADSNILESVEADEENYAYHFDEVVKTFYDLLDETYLSFYKEDKNLVAKIVTINLEKKFQELLDKNKTLILMSGTLHSEKVLNEIFGLKNFKVIEAETKMPGKLEKGYTETEINCKYSNFKSGKITRKQYLFSLQQCMIQAKKPVLVHVNSFRDLPSEKEKQEFGLNLMSKEKLKQLQKQSEKLVERFKKKQISVLYTTKCNRGADFPGDMCNSIILTKYPYPDISSIFWRILKKNKPEYFKDFYIDKARREFLQRIYRGLRSEEDHIYLFSPDIRVFYQI